MKIAKYLIVSLGVGYICTVLFMLLFMGFNDVTTQIFAWLIASAVYGVASIIFENEKLSTLVKCMIHFLICLTVTSIITMIFYRNYAISVCMSFTIAYAVVFLVISQIEKYNIKKINEKLQNK